MYSYRQQQKDVCTRECEYIKAFVTYGTYNEGTLYPKKIPDGLADPTVHKPRFTMHNVARYEQ